MKSCLSEKTALAVAIGHSNSENQLLPVLRWLLLVCMVLLLAFLKPLMAQATSGNEEYLKVITQRADKIVKPLGITDSVQYYKVRGIIVQQYSTINATDEQYKAAVTEIKSGRPEGDARNSALKAAEESRNAYMQQQHEQYVHALKQNLTDSQVEEVKNGMTYNLLNVTYTAYTDMIPSLKPEEQNQIRDWLTEARELAMDGASSDAKHAVFGKYKGRINNYLSGRGYDLTKEREGWMKRINDKKNN